MTTLITGGAGYVGSHTVVALHVAGRDVVVLDDFSNARRDVIDGLRSLTAPDLIVVEGDAAHRPTIERLCDEHGVDSIVHFAACKSVPESFADPLRYYRNNVASTLSLVEVAAERGIGQFVFSSSAVVYGRPEILPVTEETPAAPQSPYGATKLMCEHILTDAAAASSMSVVILRYFNPVGAHSSGRIGERPLAVAQSLVPVVMGVAEGVADRLRVFGQDYDTRDGTAIRDFVHVADLADGHVAAIDADLGEQTSRIFNLGTGVGTTVFELIAAAAKVTGRPIPYEIADRRPGDIEASWADCSRAHAELGWRAERDLAQMLTDHWHFAQRCRHLGA